MNTNGTNDYLLSEALKLGTFKSSDSNIFGGNMYFSGSYEDRIKDLEYLRDLAADKYNETRIDDYRQYASRLDEQINNLKSGLDAKNNAETALANALPLITTPWSHPLQNFFLQDFFDFFTSLTPFRWS